MRKRRILYFTIFVLAVIMAVILFYFLLIMQKPLLDHVKFRETVCNQEIDFYHDETDDIYYLFLPAYATTQELKIENSGVMKVNFSDDEIDYGNDLAAAPLETNLTMTLTNFYQRETYTVQLWKCDQLSTVYVETDSGNLDYVNEDKENEEDASVLFVNAEGDVEFSGMSVITGRGNGTWGRAKNPYNLKFSSKISVGPFDAVDTLCFLAEYSDESKLCNGISYYIGQQVGISYASPYMYVNLYLNGEYYGLYGVATKKEYEKYIESDSIQAVFEIASSENTNEFYSELGRRINVMYGDLDYVQERVSQLENILQTENWEECDLIIDMSSWAEKYIFEEFIANFDLIYASQYFYIDNEGIIHCMLPWDYDWSLGSSVTYFNNLQEYEIIAFRKYYHISCWYTLLLDDDEFVACISEILEHQYTEEFIEEIVIHLRVLAESIQTSRECDKVRWEHAPPYNGWDTDSGMESVEEFVEYFQTYFPKRVSFLKDYFSNQENYNCVELYTDINYINLCIPTGENLQEYLYDSNFLNLTRGKKYELSGWFSDDGQSLDDIDFITEDITFKGAWIETESENPNIEVVLEEPEDNPTEFESTLDKSNIFIRMLKRAYHGTGLDSFGRRRLLLLGVFGLVFLGLIAGEVVHGVRQRRGE